jgi:hypothetical protein
MPGLMKDPFIKLGVTKDPFIAPSLMKDPFTVASLNPPIPCPASFPPGASPDGQVSGINATYFRFAQVKGHKSLQGDLRLLSI